MYKLEKNHKLKLTFFCVESEPLGSPCWSVGNLSCEQHDPEGLTEGFGTEETDGCLAE